MKTTVICCVVLVLTFSLWSDVNSQAVQNNQPSFKQRLKNGEHLTGSFITFLQGPDSFQFMKSFGGLDFFILDTEHGSYDVSEIREIIVAARASNAYSLVRVPEPGHHQSRVLDMGADGIIIPLVETRSQAEKLVRYGRYTPEGKRGIISVAGHNDFTLQTDETKFIADRNRDVLLFVMIETMEGVKNRESILSTPGIDGCILGTADLAMDMGYAGQLDDPAVTREVNNVIETCRNHNLIVSLPIRRPQDVAKWVNAGMNMVIFGSDINLLGGGIKLFQDALKESLK